MKARARWRGLPPWARWVTGIVVIVVLLNVGLSLLRSMYAGPEGRPSSAYATAPNGIAAFAELLAVNDHPVLPLRGPLAENLPDGGTLMVLEPETMSAADVSALDAWLANGGHLVIGGNSALWVDKMFERAPKWSPAGILDGSPLAPVPETAGISHVAGEGFGSWEDTGAALPVVGLTSEAARTLVAVATPGTGRAVLLADPSILHNRFLARADNAAFGLNLAGPAGSEVYFAEGVHGYGNETGLAAIPTRWKVALGGLALAALVWMIAAGRRLGPPQPEGRDLPPPRRAYVDALTTTLARTKRGNEVVAPLRAAARAKIARRTGLANDASDAAVEGAARGLGLTDDEIAAVLGRGGVIPTGRALVKLGGRDW